MVEHRLVLKHWLKPNKKVVLACLDPNPLVAGQGIKILQDAGIEVETDVCTESAAALNFGF